IAKAILAPLALRPFGAVIHKPLLRTESRRCTTAWKTKSTSAASVSASRMTERARSVVSASLPLVSVSPAGARREGQPGTLRQRVTQKLTRGSDRGSRGSEGESKPAFSSPNSLKAALGKSAAKAGASPDRRPAKAAALPKLASQNPREHHSQR